MNKLHQHQEVMLRAKVERAQSLKLVLVKLQTAEIARNAAAQGPTVPWVRNNIVSQISSSEAVANASELEAEAIEIFDTMVQQAAGALIGAIARGEVIMDEKTGRLANRELPKLEMVPS